MKDFVDMKTHFENELAGLRYSFGSVSQELKKILDKLNGNSGPSVEN